jgi:hypothetical protein
VGEETNSSLVAVQIVGNFLFTVERDIVVVGSGCGKIFSVLRGRKDDDLEEFVGTTSKPLLMFTNSTSKWKVA